MPSSPEPSLDDLLAGCLRETPDVKVRDGEIARNGVVFASRESDVVELRLGPEIAEAALRTPGATPSARGEDWVRLAPSDWSSAFDRLQAWYRVAWRIAGKRKR